MVVAHIDQTSESDANLLTRLAEQFDAVATVKSKSLLFFKAGTGQTASGRPLAPVLFRREDGDKHTFSVAERENYTAVKAFWQNVDGAKRAKSPSTPRPNTVASTTRQKGQAEKRSRLQATSQPKLEPAADNVKVLRHVYATEATATRAARAAWEKLQRGVAEFSLSLARGRPELIPERPARASGWKPIIDNTKWLIASVEHDLSNSAYTSSVKLEMRLDQLEE